eukprot:gene4094-4774_t
MFDIFLHLHLSKIRSLMGNIGTHIAREIVPGFNKSKFNVVFVGSSGAGKSSLVNGLLGYSDSDPRAAKVDEIECTQTLKAFQHPTTPDLVLWDCPGAGTQSQPYDNYYFRNNILAFDAIVIVVSQRVMEVDSQVFNFNKDRHLYGGPEVKCIVVWNKADETINSKKRRSPDSLQSTIAQEVKQQFIAEVQRQLGVTPFVVSSWAYLDRSIPMIDELALKQELGIRSPCPIQ